jgi:hypothetical protein
MSSPWRRTRYRSSPSVISPRLRGRRLNGAAARRHRWRLLHAGIGLKHGAARTRELRGILAQARRDPVDVRYLVEAKTPNVGCAGHLLFKRSTILLGKSRSLNADDAGDRQPKAQNNPLCLHIHPSVGIWLLPVPPRRTKSCPMNEASEGSVGQQNVKEVPHHPATTFSSTLKNAW